MPFYVRLITCLLLLGSLSGGHWGVCQIVAWSGMIVTYSQEDGLVQGLADTFSGERPCHLCHEIDQQRQQEQQDTPALVTESQSLTAVLAASADRVAASRLLADDRWVMPELRCGPTAVASPETPPPRC